MSKRKRSKKRDYRAPYQPLDLNSVATIPQTEIGPDGREYTVRRINTAVKDYVCPACDTTVGIGSAHIVAWPNDSLFGTEYGLEQRRHWHLSCWRRKLRPTY